jgi:hypothetical protein
MTDCAVCQGPPPLDCALPECPFKNQLPVFQPGPTLVGLEPGISSEGALDSTVRCKSPGCRNHSSPLEEGLCRHCADRPMVGRGNSSGQKA